VDAPGAFVRAGGALAASMVAAISLGGRGAVGVEFKGDLGPLERLSCRVAQRGVLGELDGFDVALAASNFARLARVAAAVVAT